MAAFDDDENAPHRAFVLQAVTRLGNRVVRDNARRLLQCTKRVAPQAFTSPYLLYQIFKLLETYRFALEQRRVIYELFDTVRFNDAAFFKDVDGNVRKSVLYDTARIEATLTTDSFDIKAIEREAAALAEREKLAEQQNDKTTKKTEKMPNNPTKR